MLEQVDDSSNSFWPLLTHLTIRIDMVGQMVGDYRESQSLLFAF